MTEEEEMSDEHSFRVSRGLVLAVALALVLANLACLCGKWAELLPPCTSTYPDT
jgi:hypothetical protein